MNASIVLTRKIDSTVSFVYQEEHVLLYFCVYTEVFIKLRVPDRPSG